MPNNGLRCPACDLIEDSVFYRLVDGPPDCPECGAPRDIWWGHGQAPGLFSDEKPALNLGRFADPEQGELAKTRSGQKQLVAQIEAAKPGKRVVFEPPGPARKVEMEEREQKKIDFRKAEGIDLKVFEEQKVARRQAVKAAEARHVEKKLTPQQAKEVKTEAVARTMEK